ncbi:MAG: cupin domain-containing protein [bacterium]
MKIDKAQNVAAGPVKEADAKGVTMRVLMSDKDGAPNFIMRVFEIAPGGHTLYHAHAWEHEVYVLGGRGAVRQHGRDHPIDRDSFALVAPNEEHQFVNLGDEPLRFICVIPAPGRKE